jgi:hypothetical protein
MVYLGLQLEIGMLSLLLLDFAHLDRSFHKLIAAVFLDGDNLNSK